MSTLAPRDRALAAALVVLLHAAVLCLLLAAHGATLQHDAPTLATFDVTPPQPPPPPLAPRADAHAAAPAGLAGRTARRTPVTAPLPVVVPPPAPIVAATLPDVGSAAVGGAAATGAGTGAASGEVGNGAGGSGAGTGGGTRARLMKGTIRNGDYPVAERKAEVEGTVTVTFTVGTDGRARDCRVQRSSGSAALDSVTCKLIVERFRYASATDASGRKVAEERAWQQRWWLLDKPGGVDRLR